MQQVGHNSDYPPEDAPVKPHQRFAELRSNEIDQCHLYKTIKVDIVNDEHGNDEEGTTLNDVIVPTLVLDIVMQQKNSNLHNVGQRSRSQESMECNYDDDDDDNDDNDDDNNDSGTQQQQQKQQCEASGYVFWLQEEKYCKDLKHGYIYTGALLKPCTRTATNRTTKNRGQKLRSKLEDEEFRLRLKHTEHRCAVKVYNIQKLENHREGSGSDSRSAAGNEIAAMQYFSTYYPIPMDLQDDIQWIQNSMYRNNIMMPLGVYRDDTNIYYIMPHADGGNLHNTLDERKGKKMTEGEARYWMNQILNGLETLQRAGICHRSISLDHLVTDKYNRLLIIDMGMGIKIPYVDGDDHKQRQRCLIKRDNAFIKEDSVQQHFMSPEIRAYMTPSNEEPFDGHAVDIWALGPILFAMVTGFPPWQIADKSDEWFWYLACQSEGNVHLACQHLRLELSDEIVEMLQRMFRIKPRERLGLEQIRAHPWMQGDVQIPAPRT